MSPRLACRSVARTHVGRVRRLNEDRFLARPDAGLWAVADGMGGHQAGEVASSLIVEALADLEPHDTGYGYLGAVRDRLRAANTTLVTRAAALPPGGVIGSTVVALLAFEDHYACVWAGDSRAYLLRDRTLVQLTHDHSMVQELVDAGALQAGVAMSDSRANLITRAVGARPDLTLDSRNGAMVEGDLFLLCSDGLTGLVSDEEIGDILRSAPMEAAADELIGLSLARGAKDNVTLVLIRAEAIVA
jgi:serine/threonine protein phosphatase PrpC